VTVAVLTRLLFDLNFWTPPHQRHPLLLAFEEAHNYIPRVEARTSFAKIAVERVAKEGRKYGVAALVISQRPAELSETVLAQCNSLIAMRLSNPEDQQYIAKVVSDQFASLIEMLPILRPGEAFIIGDSVLMPMRTLIDLPDRLPDSGDVDFFGHWSAFEPVSDTDEIIDHWRRQDRQILNRMTEGAPLNAEIPPPEEAEPKPAKAPSAPPLRAKSPWMRDPNS
jgi:DNA helicase HerA-like ATPase